MPRIPFPDCPSTRELLKLCWINLGLLHFTIVIKCQLIDANKAAPYHAGNDSFYSRKCNAILANPL